MSTEKEERTAEVLAALMLADLRPERLVVLEWLAKEWAYSGAKWSPDTNDHRDRDLAEHGSFSPDDSWWRNSIQQYLHRASVLTLDTPGGRQALMKALMTLEDCAESMVRVHGAPPAPGHASGEVHEWAR